MPKRSDVLWFILNAFVLGLLAYFTIKSVCE